MKNIKKNRPKVYTSVTTSSKPKKRKKHDFQSKVQNESVNRMGMDLEKSAVKQRSCFFFLGLILSLALLLIDVRDKGMTFELFGIKYTGSLVGVILAIACIYGMINNKSKVTIE